jgi:hypothetical protein
MFKSQVCVRDSSIIHWLFLKRPISFYFVHMQQAASILPSFFSEMASKQALLRQRIVQYFLTHQDHGKVATARHFMDEGVPKCSIYRILRNYDCKHTTERSFGSGRPAKIMTATRVKWLKKKMVTANHPSTRAVARTLNCSQQHVSKTIISKCLLHCYKKKKDPRYSEEQSMNVKKACRKLYHISQGMDFVVDDEKYFSLSGSGMPGNAHYYVDKINDSIEPDHVKSKKKFEPKVMLRLAISSAGLSKPYLVPSGIAVNKEIYIRECLQRRLLPFIKSNHAEGTYIFWPDKASSHYAKDTQAFLKNENINFVPREVNPTDLSQCRPIDLFGQLAQAVYKNGWIADNIDQLRNRIKYCLRTTDFSSVQGRCRHIRQQLCVCYSTGPYSCLH